MRKSARNYYEEVAECEVAPNCSGMTFVVTCKLLSHMQHSYRQHSMGQHLNNELKVLRQQVLQ